MTATTSMGSGPSSVSRILTPTDFSPPSESALAWGLRLAMALGANLVLLHVIDVFSYAAGVEIIGSASLLPPLREEAKRRMQRWQARAPSAEVVILEGSPRPLIVESALELQCQMIVMGTHGRSGLAHLLLGSVAEYVVRHSKVPVPTVRA